MTKIDADKVSKAIDNMDSVCEKGKKEIRDVLSAMGVEFKVLHTCPKLKAGQIWKSKLEIDNPLRLVINTHDKYICVGLHNFFQQNTRSYGANAEDVYEFVANNLKDYLASGGTL